MATKKPNFADAIIIPAEIPEQFEAHFEALKRAKRVITILSAYTGVIHDDEIFAYTIKNGQTGDLRLPKDYNFDWFKIKFLPGWWSYFVIIDVPNTEKIEISIKTPQGKEEFQDDLELIRNFIPRYLKASGEKNQRNTERKRNYFERPKTPEISNKQREVILFKNELKKLGRMVTPVN